MKKTIIILLAAIILSLVTSCQGDLSDDNAVSEKVTNVYKSDFINIPDNINVSGSDFQIYEDRIYFTCYEVLDEETWEIRYALYSVGLDGSNENINYDIFDDSGYVNQFAILSDGRIVFVKSSYDETKGTQNYVVTIYDKDFNELNSFVPNDMFSEQGDYFYINHLKATSDDILYMSSEMSIVAVTTEGEKLFEVTCDDFINNMNAAPDGRIVVSYYERNSETGGGYVFRYIDPQKKEFGDYVEYPQTNSYNSYDNNIYFGEGYDMYLKDSKGIYGYNTGETEKTLLLDFLNSDINPNSANNIKIISENKFIYQGYDYFINKQQLAILTRVPDDEIVPKKIIKMAFIYVDTYELTNAVISFNRSNEEYRIIMQDYSQYNSSENYNLGQEKFNNDIAAGNISDIMIFSTGSQLENYIKKGLFIDLYEFMENKNILLDCIRNVYETDGKLYQMPMSFTVNAMIGKKSIFGDNVNWTVDEMIQLMEEYPESYLTSDMSQRSLLTILLYFGINDYINYDNATCDFENDEFIGLLKYISGMNEKALYEVYDDYWENRNKYFNDNTVLMESMYASSFVDFMRMKIQFKEDVTIKGFPSNKGNGIILSSNSIYAISSKSKVKNGAWEFIELMLSDDVQTSGRSYGFPVTEVGLMKKAETEMAQYYYFDNSGNGWSSSDSPLDSEYYSEDDGTFAQLSQEDVDYVYEFLKQVDTTVSIDETLINIITEEVDIFLEGSKSAEETAKVIQSRVGIYISENY